MSLVDDLQVNILSIIHERIFEFLGNISVRELAIKVARSGSATLPKLQESRNCF